MILSYLDYPFFSSTSRRISGLVTCLQGANFRTQIISAAFRLPNQDPSPGVLKVGMRFARILGQERLVTRIVQCTLFNLYAFVRILISRKEIIALQYESIYSFPAALLARVFCHCRCIGDDIIIPRMIHRLILPELALAVASELILTSSINVTHGPLSRTRVIHVPTGVSEQFAHERRRITFEKIKPVFIGTLTYRPNISAVNELSKVSARLAGKMNFEFLVIGGPIPPTFRSSGVLKLLGTVDDHFLAEVYKERNIGVLPFFGIASEGPKVKLIEYMAARLLVLSSPECSVDYPELAAWKDYVPIGSVEETARILSEILANPKKFARIAENGHRLVMTRYRWPILLKQYVKFMERLRSRSPNSHVG